MSLDPALRERIAGILASHRVVLFMKGTRAAPRCGFSAGAVGTLDGLLEAYHDIDVLADADLREGIKAYGNWPTIPQLYIGGELVGGSDIIQQLAGSGELHALLGVAAPDRTPPAITITAPAADAIRAALADAGDDRLHVAIDGRYRTQFLLKPA
ncbi:MAG: Grx4 family monothiol glutaredoxin, partial [Xanthomonadales bacterium]|nr:Grx4 family monothiol glutaredoxin [Xanthomonadales bacterium]